MKDSVPGTCTTANVPCPLLFEHVWEESLFKSDHVISYHKVKTVKYWKTLFYHFIDMATVNSHIIYNYLAIQNGMETMSENQFHDKLVLEIITTP